MKKQAHGKPMKRLGRDSGNEDILGLLDTFARRERVSLTSTSADDKFVQHLASSIKQVRASPILIQGRRTEKMFGFSKDDLGLVPVRVHSEEAIRGLLFLQFLSLIAFVQLKDKIGKEYTVEDILLTMRNLKCKVYDDEILVSELTKQQKQIEEKIGILLPKKLGI